MFRPITLLFALGPNFLAAQTACPLPDDMATGVRLHFSADVHGHYWQNPDTPDGILAETDIEGQLYARKVPAAGLYVVDASVDETRSDVGG